MKNTLRFGLALCLISGACFAQNPKIEQLIAEKQEKMKKLEDCQGTTKKLKIAGISTLGVSAVGAIANLAEANILSTKKAELEDAKFALKKQKDLQKKLENSSGTKEAPENTPNQNYKTDVFTAANFENRCTELGGKPRQSSSEQHIFYCDFDAKFTDLDQALKTARDFWAKMGCTAKFNPDNVFAKRLSMTCHYIWSKEKEFSGFIDVHFDKAICPISDLRYHHKAGQCTCTDDKAELNDEKTKCVKKNN